MRRMLALRPAAWLSALVFLGYMATSRAVEDLYPFSTFSMYARHGQPAVSRLAARTADGQAHPVRDFVAWSCEGPIDTGPVNTAPNQHPQSTPSRNQHP